MTSLSAYYSCADITNYYNKIASSQNVPIHDLKTPQLSQYVQTYNLKMAQLSQNVPTRDLKMSQLSDVESWRK